MLASGRDGYAGEEILVHVEKFDLGDFALLLGGIGHQAVGNFGAQFLLDLGKCRRLGDTPLGDGNDMPSELGFYRLGDAAGLEREGGVGEFSHHLFRAEEAQLAAFGRGRADRVASRGRGKIRARFQFRDDLFGFLFAGDENMADIEFLSLGEIVEEFSVAFLQQLIIQVNANNVARIIIMGEAHDVEINSRGNSRIVAQSGRRAENVRQRAAWLRLDRGGGAIRPGHGLPDHVRLSGPGPTNEPERAMPQMVFADYVPQLVWLAITFIAFYALMARVALPRIAEILDQRQSRVAGDLEQATALRDEAAKALAEYEASMADARAQAHAIAAAAREEIAEEAARQRAEIEAKLVAENIAQQLVRRVAFRRAMKRAVQSAMRLGADGIRINCGGRLGGAEIARTEWYREGRVPLHTLRADVDYGCAAAQTAYGTCGVKVWIFKGEILDHDPMAQDKRAQEHATPR